MYASKLVLGAGQRFESARRLCQFGLHYQNPKIEGAPGWLLDAF
jgi:hypothetical protein